MIFVENINSDVSFELISHSVLLCKCRCFVYVDFCCKHKLSGRSQAWVGD